MLIWYCVTKRHVGLLLLALALALLQGCGPPSSRAPVGDRSERPARIPDTHKVRIGDTLFSIAFLYGLSVDEVARWNGLREPYTIYGGQTLRLKPPPRVVDKTAVKKPAPPPQPKIQPSRPKVVSPDVRPSRPKTTAPVRAPVPAAKPKRTPAVTTQPREPSFARHVIWGWPAQGRLVRTYNANAQGKKGIDIAGEIGDPVRAAAAGKVVYAGSGLSGYGRLIIIKHNNDFLSAYAHNRKLIATEGQWVRKHEVIAHMGNSGSARTALHFEIRKNGRPVDPLRYLPKR